MGMKIFLLIILLTYSFFVHGVIFHWLAYKGILPQLLPKWSILVIGALSCIWVYIDARQNKYSLKKWILVVAFFLPIIGVPIYLYKHRDKESRRKSMIGFFGFVLLMIILYIIGTFIVDFLLEGLYGWA